MTPAPDKKPDRRPPYQHAADELRRDIRRGRIKPGEQMPSVRELQERFGIANMTARSALNVLRDEGLIYTIHGRGSFVADISDATGEFTIDYNPPAWYLAKKAEAEGEEEGGAGKPDGESAGSSLTDLLTALRDEIRALSAEHQELRREVEALKRAQQEPKP
ncbi:SCO5717 family growth-regulating ATPase [Streptomyces sp. SID8499]|uniref:SCO5717 family growth-regulating ATPase n=1 Tax=Streptomyces sp. SID8499 TaxID=2706106 RepID=UPI0013C635B2|nr:SCO5717 family growth-regulating ATPase [Streptomyces sp. SID8499]NED34861.1 winged helix-turn-helix transcriptional regulator [Streptomyces sp. SID8499]